MSVSIGFASVDFGTLYQMGEGVNCLRHDYGLARIAFQRDRETSGGHVAVLADELLSVGADLFHLGRRLQRLRLERLHAEALLEQRLAARIEDAARLLLHEL